MPIVRVSMWEGKTLEQKRELVQVLTRETARIGGTSEDAVTVILEEIKKENWGISGQLSSDRFPNK